MNKFKLLSLATVIALSFTACTNAPKSDDATTTDEQTVTDNAGAAYKVDAAASTVKWIGTKVSGYHVGEIKVKEGTVSVANGNVTGGNFIMDMTTINTTGPKDSEKEWNDKLTGHLTSPDFFDVAKYPDAKFEITGVKPFAGTVTDDNDARQDEISQYKVTDPTHIVSGNLTMKDVTKNIEFPAKIVVTDNSVDATAKFNINRQQWGLSYPGKPDDLIRDEIHMGIALKATK